MTNAEPVTTLDSRYSSPDATAVPWTNASQSLAAAGIYWLSTVRPDGRPHVTPLIGVWVDDSFVFCTGADERKARNLAGNAHCVITTGCNSLDAEGLDVIIEGDAKRVQDVAVLQRIADAYDEKYGSDWHFTVENGALVGAMGNVAAVFQITPQTAFGFGRGATSSQTRWSF